MTEFLRTAPAQAVIWVSVALIMTIIAVYILRNLRDQVKQEDTTSDHLTKFTELRHRGVLDESEFRTIKTVLGDRESGELKGDGEQS